MEFTSYQPKDIDPIVALFEKTFTDSEGEAEGKVLGVFARDMMETTPAEDLQVFIAKEGDVIVGSVMFSTFTLPDGRKAKLLSPMAVSTEHQGKGIGQALITHALDALKAQGVDIALTYGDPSFYSKVGFVQISEDVIKAPMTLSYPHGWLAQSLTDEALTPVAGETRCVAALNKPELW